MLGGDGQEQVAERAPGSRRGLAGGQWPGQSGRVAGQADGQDDDCSSPLDDVS